MKKRKYIMRSSTKNIARTQRMFWGEAMGTHRVDFVLQFRISVLFTRLRVWELHVQARSARLRLFGRWRCGCTDRPLVLQPFVSGVFFVSDLLEELLQLFCDMSFVI